ncbi:hypothetical protein N0V90_008761 [Kalmusia sp. IMI 367209]|nr:hypothetical protein N0V90_008761 [Kalmusia sp. IMI 367209]
MVAVGNPPQEFAVLPATNVANTWVPIADDCKALNVTDCGSKRGVYPFNNTISPGFQQNLSSTWENIGRYKLGQNSFLGFTGNGNFGYDTVALIRGDASKNIQVNHHPVTAYATPEFWLGEIGLGNREMDFGQGVLPSSFLTDLKDAKSIPSLSYGYTAGVPYRSLKIPGSLTLGGYDQGRMGENLKVPINDDDDRPLTIAVQKITASDSLNGDVELSTTPFLAPIDSSVTDLWLPKSVCDEFESAFGLQYNSETNRYILASRNQTLLQQNSPSLNFTIGSQLTDGTNITIQLPYSAFDLQAGLPIFMDPLSYFPIRRAVNSSQYMIGRVLLQEMYLVVDYERNFFNVSQANYSQAAPAVNIVTIEPVDMPTDRNSTTGSPNDSGKKHRLSSGIIAGVSVAAIFVVALLIGIWWYYHPRRRQRFELEARSNDQSSQPVMHAEILGSELAELESHHRGSELPGEKFDSVEIGGAQKLVHEMPTPVYELPMPIPELR